MADAMPQPRKQSPSRPHRASVLLLARGAGLGVGWFVLVVILLHVLQRDDYDAVEQTVSDLALGSYGYLMTSAFVTLGAAELSLALALWRSVERARVAPILLVAIGVTDLLSAVFETDPTGAPETTHGAIHNGIGLVGFLLVVPMLLLFSRSFHHDPHWRSFSLVTFAWAVLGVVAFVFVIIHAEGDLFGVAQKVFIAVWISWYFPVVWRLLKSR